MLPVASVLRIPPATPARTKMGQVPNRSSNRPELRLLGSFRNFAVGSFRNRRYPPVAAPFRYGAAMRQHADRRENSR
jgi:hypothetical protein